MLYLEAGESCPEIFHLFLLVVQGLPQLGLLGVRGDLPLQPSFPLLFIIGGHLLEQYH